MGKKLVKQRITNKQIKEKLIIHLRTIVQRCPICKVIVYQESQMRYQRVSQGSYCPKCGIRLVFNLFDYSRLSRDACCSGSDDPNTFIITEINGTRLAMCKCGRTWKLKKKSEPCLKWVEGYGMGHHENRVHTWKGLGRFLFKVDMDKF